MGERACSLRAAHSSTGAFLPGVPLEFFISQSLPFWESGERLSRPTRLFSQRDPKDIGPETTVGCAHYYMDTAEFIMEAADELPALVEAAKDVPVALRYFNRSAEMQWLQSAVDAEPDEVIILFGPTDSGKTRFIKEFAARNKGRTMRINGGTTILDSPNDLAVALQRSFQQLSLHNMGWAKYMSFISEVMRQAGDEPVHVRPPRWWNAFSSAVFGPWTLGKADDLESIQRSLAFVLENLPAFYPVFESKRPIIIIGE